jgi:hypothetical protein
MPAQGLDETFAKLAGFGEKRAALKVRVRLEHSPVHNVLVYQPDAAAWCLNMEGKAAACDTIRLLADFTL